MTLGELVLKCYSSAPSVDDFTQYADGCGATLEESLLRVAEEVANGFMSGRYTWDFADVVMNNLYTATYVLSNICLPPRAFAIFEAFDEGEYRHDSGKFESQGEWRTRDLLSTLLSTRDA